MHLDSFFHQFSREKNNYFKSFVDPEEASNMIERETENRNWNKFKGNGDWKVWFWSFHARRFVPQ